MTDAPSVRALPSSVTDLRLTRVGANCLVLPLLAELGQDPAGVAAVAGIDIEALADPEALVPIAAIDRLIRAALAATGRRDLGLLIAARAGSRFVGAQLRVIAEGGTMRDGLARLAARIQVNTRSAAARVVADDEGLALELSANFPEPDLAALFEDAVVTIAVASLHTLAGAAWRPARVEFAHAPTAPVAVYDRLLGCRPRFNRLRSAILVAAADLDRPLRLPVEAGAYVADPESRLGLGLVDRARAAIRARLADPELDRASLAAAMGLSTRTLGRRLADQGSNFAGLLQETRFLVARQLLAGSDSALGDIGLAIGFPDQSAFSRAFRQWSGMSPRCWRAQHRAHR